MQNLDAILGQIKNKEEEKLKAETTIGDPRILNLKKGCKYIGRLVPNLKDVDNTFVSYEEIGWTSKTSGDYINAGRSPSSAKVKDDPVKKVQWESYKAAKDKGDEAAAKDACKLIPKRKQFVNFYLTGVEGNDNAAKEKIGEVVVLKYPAQLDKEKKPSSDIYKIIHDGIFGEKAKKIGTKAFDLSKNGRSLLVKVTDKGGFNNYASSEFDDAEDLGLTKAQIDEILSKAHDLKEFVPAIKSNDELKKLLDEHWFGTEAGTEDDVDVPADDESEDDDDEIPGLGKDEGDDDLDSLLKD